MASTSGCLAILGITLCKYFRYPPLIPPPVMLRTAIIMLLFQILIEVTVFFISCTIFACELGQ